MTSMDLNITLLRTYMTLVIQSIFSNYAISQFQTLIRDYLPLLDEILHQSIPIPGTEEPGYSGVYRYFLTD